MSAINIRLTSTSANPSLATRSFMESSAIVDVLIPAPHATTINLLISCLPPCTIVDYQDEQIEASPAAFLLLENSPSSGSLAQPELTPQPGFNPMQTGLVPQFN